MRGHVAFGATGAAIKNKGPATDLLGQIELAGWHLEQASWVYVQTGHDSRDKFLTSGQQVVVRGEVVGIYLFRGESEPLAPRLDDRPVLRRLS